MFDFIAFTFFVFWPNLPYCYVGNYQFTSIENEDISQMSTESHFKGGGGNIRVYPEQIHGMSSEVYNWADVHIF